MTNVKICGIRFVESALIAVESGADFIGLNFILTSKRKITINHAKEIVDNVRGDIGLVGIFKDQSIEEVNSIIAQVGLEYAQLHGNETPEYVTQIKAKVIKAFSLPKDFNVQEVIHKMKTYPVDYYLVDREKQGEGSMVSTEKLQFLCQELPIFVAGGLTPENVSSVVQYVQPFGVDVAGGIETNGKEDMGKIRLFIQNAKRLEI